MLRSGTVLVFTVIAAHATDPAASPEFFESKIRPVLAGSCYSCHTNSALGGLRLDSREAMLKGGKRGPAVVPGDPDKSVLVRAIQQTDSALKMPLGGKLKDSEIEDIVAWIKAGAVWPASPAATAAAKQTGDRYVITPEQRAFWSLQPLQNPPAPVVKDADWPHTEIDRFVLAHL